LGLKNCRNTQHEKSEYQRPDELQRTMTATRDEIARLGRKRYGVQGFDSGGGQVLCLLSSIRE
jgi:hypothetical protein